MGANKSLFSRLSESEINKTLSHGNCYANGRFKVLIVDMQTDEWYKVEKWGEKEFHDLYTARTAGLVAAVNARNTKYFIESVDNPIVQSRDEKKFKRMIIIVP